MASSGISQPAIFMSCTLLIQAADSLQHPLADLSQACPKHSRRYPWAPLGESANYGWGIFYRIPTAHKIWTHMKNLEFYHPSHLIHTLVVFVSLSTCVYIYTVYIYMLTPFYNNWIYREDETPQFPLKQKIEHSSSMCFSGNGWDKQIHLYIYICIYIYCLVQLIWLFGIGF